MAIGIRYLWVDSLCIAQDDECDKQNQLPIMDSIYSHANLVIVSAAGMDAHTGIPGVGTTKRRVTQRKETIKGIRFITAQPAVQQQLERTTWTTRGWTFQEAQLARRILIFTDNVVYWNCRRSTWRDDMTGDSLGSEVGLSLLDINSIWGQLAELHEDAVCRTVLYCRQVVEFSRRTFQDHRDVLWAFLGILKLQAARFPKGFIWGLPWERLDATLLWTEEPRCDYVHPRDVYQAISRGGSYYDIPYPTWSWLSTTTPINFKDPCGNSIISRLTWHTPFIFGHGDEAAAAYLRSITGSKRGLVNASDKRPSADWLTGVDGMCFGLLHFTASIAKLRVRIDPDGSSGITERNIDGQAPGDKSSGHNGDEGRSNKREDTRDMAQDAGKANSRLDEWAYPTVYAPNGAPIARMMVAVRYFRGKPERTGEFVVLSSNVEKKPDEHCKIQAEGLDCGTINHEQAGLLRFWRQQYSFKPQQVRGVSLQGKTAIVTGSNTGVGFETCRQLLDLGLSRLILAVRNEEKGKAAAHKLWLGRSLEIDTIQVWPLDLSVYESVVTFAERTRRLDSLDIVNLNAGITPSTRVFNEHTGHDEVIQVNYLSTALLAILLLPVIQEKRANQAEPTRITFTTSEASAWTKFKEKTKTPLLAALDKKGKVDMVDRMMVSKLLGLFFVKRLAEIVPPYVAVINAASPGAINDSEFNREWDKTFTGSIAKMVLRRIGSTCADGGCQMTNALVPCITSAASAIGCGAYDFACQCTSSAQLQSSAENCVLSACGLATELEVVSAASAVCTACV
ncbi:hypothetical protein VMCG_10069 [Cytospora schulzeri]|uniref:CFEM domain-containing protein n=1 Tax=Cytospora schulzeri TaxID=448051 RepID=A0A423VD90_9PEZI|nr:hypothetical protein VMCG_10069 [Valsa malicola]